MTAMNGDDSVEVTQCRMMRRSLAKMLLLAEVAICFSLVSVELIAGLLFVPSQIKLLSHGYYASAIWLLLCTGGVFGVIGLYHVVQKILHPAADVPSSRVLWCLIFAGMGSLSYFIVLGWGDSFGILPFAVPLLCSAHLVYLARHYLFGRKNHVSHQETKLD